MNFSLLKNIPKRIHCDFARKRKEFLFTPSFLTFKYFFNYIIGMIEQLISLGMGIASGSLIAFLFYKIFTRKYEKLLNFANEMAENYEAMTKQQQSDDNAMTKRLQSDYKAITEQEQSELDELNQEIRELRKQLISTKEPRMYNFIKQKIAYLERRKAYMLSELWQYRGKQREAGIPLDFSQVNWQELLANVDKLPDEQLMALVNQFKRYIPKQFRAYANNPLLVRMFLKHIAPLLIPKQEQQVQPQPPEKKEVISI
jgi:hypothetical protein